MVFDPNKYRQKKLDRYETYIKSLKAQNIEPASIDKTIMVCEKEFGSVDVCINLAYPKSITWGESFEDISIEQISHHLNLEA